MPCSRSPGRVVSQHALQQVSWGVSRPTPRGEVEGSGQGGVSRPTPRGVSRPTPEGSFLRFIYKRAKANFFFDL